MDHQVSRCSETSLSLSLFFSVPFIRLIHEDYGNQAAISLCDRSSNNRRIVISKLVLSRKTIFLVKNISLVEMASYIRVTTGYKNSLVYTQLWKSDVRPSTRLSKNKPIFLGHPDGQQIPKFEAVGKRKCTNYGIKPQQCWKDINLLRTKLTRIDRFWRNRNQEIIHMAALVVWRTTPSFLAVRRTRQIFNRR